MNNTEQAAAHEPLKVGDEVYLSDCWGGSVPARIAATRNLFGVDKVKLVNGYKWIDANDPKLLRTRNG